MADIKKAIKEKQPKTEKERKNSLPPEVHNFILLFMSREADKLPPFHPGIDMQIEIQCKADRTLEALP